MTAKKRVDIVRASECFRLVIGGGKFEDLGPLSRYLQENLSRFSLLSPENSSYRYAKNAGDLLLVRPRVLGKWSSDILERKEPRKYPGGIRPADNNIDNYEIKLPDGYYIVDDLPPPADSDYSFASYHSKTEANGNVLTYTRTMETKELSVPVEKLEQRKSFCRVIVGDQRNTTVLKPTGNNR